MHSIDATTQMLERLRDGDKDAAADLLPCIYDELRAVAGRIFRKQSADNTLQPTALVHEAYIKLIDQTRVEFNDKTHFFAVAATAMRQILIDHARAANAAKRGGGWNRVTLSGPNAAASAKSLDVIALDAALEKLANLDERQARIVELRFFAGLTVNEVAEVIGVSTRTVELDWKMARAWLSRELSE